MNKIQHSSEDTSSCCQHEDHPKKPWYRRLLPLSTLGIALLLAASFALPVLDAFRESFIHYVHLMTVPILLGFVAGGLIDYYIPTEYVSKYLARKSKRTVVYSAALGFLMSACSHGIITLSVELHKKGASTPAIISFLLASPWANLPITFLLIGFFGLKGFLIIFCALGVSIITGLIFQMLEKKDMIEKNRHTIEVKADFSIWKDIKRRWKEYRMTGAGVKKDIIGILKGAFDLAEMILGWTLIGVLLASLSSAFIPSEWFQRFLGPSLTGLALTLLLATVLEVCSEGTSPLAFEIYKQTGAFGNAFAFLMGGVVTDYTEIGIVWTRIGKKTALWMLAITIPQVLILGIILNYFF